MTLRFGLFALIAAPFVKWPGARWRAIFMVSVTLGFLHFALMFTGLSGIDAATAAIAIQLQVPFAALLAAIVCTATPSPESSMRAAWVREWAAALEAL